MRLHAPLQLFCHGLPPSFKVTPQHLTANDIRTIFTDEFFDYRFTIVRNPFTRIESEYKMRYIMGKSAFFRGFAPYHTWLENAIGQASSTAWHLDNHLRPQWHFVSHRLRVFRFEDGLETIMRTVAAETGLRPPEHLPHKLSTSDFDGTITWDIREEGLVREFYEQDFERFGYARTVSGHDSSGERDGRVNSDHSRLAI